MNPAELRAGLRVRQARVPDVLRSEAVKGRAVPALLETLLGRTGTVQLVTAHRTAYVEWDDGSRGGWSADCLEAIR